MTKYTYCSNAKLSNFIFRTIKIALLLINNFSCNIRNNVKPNKNRANFWFQGRKIIAPRHFFNLRHAVDSCSATALMQFFVVHLMEENKIYIVRTFRHGRFRFWHRTSIVGSFVRNYPTSQRTKLSLCHKNSTALEPFPMRCYFVRSFQLCGSHIISRHRAALLYLI